MNNRTRIRSWISLATLAAAVIAHAPSARASGGLWSAYVGASVGHASLRARDSGLLGLNVGTLGSFDRHDFAYQLTAGVRWSKLLGLEVDYFRLGGGSALPHLSFAPSLPPIVSLTSSLKNAHISQKGEAAFAVLYLPVPIVDIYLKAGVARLTTDLNAFASGSTCPSNAICPATLSPPVTGALGRTETSFAAGAGVQWQLGDWAIRGEYERFNALGEHPALESIGMMWSF